jgi:hypothetical protein
MSDELRKDISDVLSGDRDADTAIAAQLRPLADNYRSIRDNVPDRKIIATTLGVMLAASVPTYVALHYLSSAPRVVQYSLAASAGIAAAVLAVPAILRNTQ